MLNYVIIKRCHKLPLLQYPLLSCWTEGLLKKIHTSQIKVVLNFCYCSWSFCVFFCYAGRNRFCHRNNL